MFSKNDLLSQVVHGLYKSWNAAFLMNDTPYISMKPEYLTTVALGLHLAEWLRRDHLSSGFLIRFEERTTDVATRAFKAYPLPNQSQNVYGRAKKSTGEEGSVDLVIYRQSDIQPETIAVLEVKNFDQSNELLEKDIKRNLEFMELTDPEKANEIQYGILTFFLHDSTSVVKGDADKFLLANQSVFAAMAAKYNKPNIASSLMLETLANYPSLSRKEAYEADENGRPAIESEEHHHIAFGIITLQRNQTHSTSGLPSPASHVKR